VLWAIMRVMLNTRSFCPGGWRWRPSSRWRTPLGAGQYGLSFMRQTGRWEPMPFSGRLSNMADTVVSTLGPYLARYDLSGGINGSDH
jgi:hypothetical protein